MPQTPALPDPRRDEDPRPASSWPDWMDDPAYLAMRAMEEDPGEGQDPDDAPPPDVDEAELAAEAAEVLAAQERLAAVTGRRARAFLDILLGMDSRPLGHAAAGSREPQAHTPAPAAGEPLAGVIPPGFAGHVTLTVPEATMTGHADRPGELTGIGPVDPDPGANT
jgi:hypothetical protein